MIYNEEKILSLRSEGKSYKEICSLLGCSKGTVSYYCGKDQKGKTRERQRKSRKENALIRKIDSFKHPNAKKRNRRKTEIISNPNQCLRWKSDDFQRRHCSKYGERNIIFNYHDILEIYGEKTKCYLTGKEIDLKQPRTYSFDHIVPATRGGDNSFKNLGICTKEVNFAKSDLLVDEFLQLCKEVLEYNGFEVKRK